MELELPGYYPGNHQGITIILFVSKNMVNHGSECINSIKDNFKLILLKSIPENKLTRITQK